MKTMKKIWKDVLTVLVYCSMLLFLGLAACEGPEGPVGPAGPEGADGIAGPTGPAGPAGADGANGADGADGNANVTTITFHGPTYTNSVMNLNVPELTQEVIDKAAILGYVEKGGVFYPVPGITGGEKLKVKISLNTYTISSHDRFTDAFIANPGIVTVVKLVIITTTNTKNVTGNGRIESAPQDLIYNELEGAGVDISDYEAVCEYYGISAED